MKVENMKVKFYEADKLKIFENLIPKPPDICEGILKFVIRNYFSKLVSSK